MSADLARLVETAVAAAMRRRAPRLIRTGRVTAVLTGPHRLVVDGRTMAYSDAIVNPAPGDVVVYLAGPAPFVLARRR